MNYAGVHIFNELFFDNVKVPVANLVGTENRGWYHLMQSLAFERHSIAPQFYGIAKRTLEQIIKYAREIRYNGANLAQDPVVRHKLAERALETRNAQDVWLRDHLEDEQRDNTYI